MGIERIVEGCGIGTGCSRRRTQAKGGGGDGGCACVDQPVRGSSWRVGPWESAAVPTAKAEPAEGQSA